MGRRTETGPPRRESELLWALRKADSEMLTRHELQSALLDELFTSREFLFSSPANPSVKVPFGRLYHESVLASSKISAALRALVSAKDTPFPINFCKLCFLVNTGRINTTLACKFSLVISFSLTFASLPRDEDRTAHVSPDPVVAAGRGDEDSDAGRPSSQGDSQGLCAQQRANEAARNAARGCSACSEYPSRRYVQLTAPAGGS